MMATDQGDKVQRLFEEALKRKPDQRAAFLDEACGDDAELLAEVESLLAHHEDVPTSFMQPPERDPDATLKGPQPRDVAGAPIGQRIGHYMIRDRLGEGGFADVYLAEQTEPVRRRVALKIIKLGMDTKQVIARFEAERQALAMMDHPNVAKVFDAGVTPPEAGSRPYFVMEHVPGVPINEHCDRQRLSIEERLELFMQVCEAVQHAHQKGIIHRDLKPGNILVSAKEGKAIPKVIDFGVAKALHQRLTEKTIYTEHGQLIGTPEYMSPEQAEMGELDIDTRSDIYSLGVLLYELLTGALPFDPTALRKAAFAEIQRIIREVEPPKPSTRLSSLSLEGEGPGEGESPAVHIAHHRRVDRRTLLRELRGDLDWITMKALEKDRMRRYASASEFRRDVARYLCGDAVEAAPPSAMYRLYRFITRHRNVVKISTIIGMLWVLGCFLLIVLGDALGMVWLGWLGYFGVPVILCFLGLPAWLVARRPFSVMEFIRGGILVGVGVAVCISTIFILTDGGRSSKSGILCPYAAMESAMLEAHHTLEDTLGAKQEQTVTAVKSLVRFYDAWGKPAKAAQWRAKMNEEGTEESRQQGTKGKESDE